MRRPIETKHDTIKGKLQVENFSATTAEGARQDFFATMYVANLVAAVAAGAPADIGGERAGKGNKHKYKANLNELAGILKDDFVAYVVEPCPAKQAQMMGEIPS